MSPDVEMGRGAVWYVYTNGNIRVGDWLVGWVYMDGWELGGECHDGWQ